MNTVSVSLTRTKNFISEKLCCSAVSSVTSQVLYLIVLACHLLHYQCKLIAWIRESHVVGDVGAMVFLDLACYVTLLAIVYRFLLSHRGIWILAAFAGTALCLFLWPRMDYTWRCWAINLFLMIGARGKPYRRILMVYLAVFLAGLTVALIGLLTGYAFLQDKKQSYGVGWALGYIHANNASRMFLWMAMLSWLLFFRKREWAMVLVFGIVALASMFYMRCRTSAVMAVLIPASVLITNRWKPWRKWRPATRRAAEGIVIAAPFLCLLLSILLSFVLMPLIPALRQSSLWNLLSRFIQNNIALREYGVHLLGRGIDTFRSVWREFYGQAIALSILDNAYVPWMIRHGLLLTVPVLGVLSAVLMRCLRLGDRPLLLAALFILLYGMMEPASVQLHYNFTFLYLLALPDRQPAPGAIQP